MSTYYLININANIWQLPFYPKSLISSLKMDLTSPTLVSAGDFDISNHVIHDAPDGLTLNKTLMSTLE